MATVDRDVIVAELRASGYDARLFECTNDAIDPHANPDGWAHTTHCETGVAIHGICIQGWRYPSAAWIFLDRPAVLLEPDPIDPRGLWRWDHALASTFDGPANATVPRDIATWITEQLGAPDEPHCRLYRHIDDVDPHNPDVPQHWKQAWQDFTNPLGAAHHPALAGSRVNSARSDTMTDPTNFIDSYERAQVLAHAMLHLAPQPAAEFWQSHAKPMLSALLYSASPAQLGGGIQWINDTVAALTLDAAGEFDLLGAIPTSTPGHQLLANLHNLSNGQRDSIILTLRGAVAPWLAA